MGLLGSPHQMPSHLNLTVFPFSSVVGCLCEHETRKYKHKHMHGGKNIKKQLPVSWIYIQT